MMPQSKIKELDPAPITKRRFLMRKNILAKGAVRRTIAAASVFMLTCNAVAGGAVPGPNTAYAQTASGSTGGNTASSSNAEREPQTNDDDESKGSSGKTASSSNAEREPQTDEEKQDDYILASDSNADRENSWYIPTGGYTKQDDGTYVDLTTQEKLTDTYLEVETEDGETKIIYLNENGVQATNEWIKCEDGQFRYANSEGYILVDKEAKAAGGYYGSFNAEGYWTPIENIFFVSDDETIYKFAGTGGQIAVDEEKQQYYFTRDEDGNYICHQSDGTLEVSGWVSKQLYVDENGKVLMNQQGVKIDGTYYDFNENGFASPTTSAFVTDSDTGNRYYLDENGEIVKEQFVEDGEHMYYMDENGLIAKKKWILIKDTNLFRYVDKNGYVVKNDTRAAGGYYGSFDSQGYWTAIENQFFTATLNDQQVLLYSGAEGLIAQTSDNRQYCFIHNDDNSISVFLLDKDNSMVSDEQPTNTWISNTFYADEAGKLATSTLITDNNSQYYLDENGQKVTSQSTYPIKGYYYDIDENGVCTMITASFITLEGKQYYLDESGQKVTSQNNYRIGNKFYNINEDGICDIVISTLITTEDDKLYYVDGEGNMVTSQSTYPINGYYYDIDKNGVCTKIVSALITIDGNQYYLNEDGQKVTNQDKYRIGNSFYNINANGICTIITSAFITAADGSTSYYVDENGSLVTNKTNYRINDKFYNITADGICTLITSVLVTAEDGCDYYVDENGTIITSQTNYLIGGCYYNIDQNGVCTMIVSSLITIDGNQYCLDENGQKVTSQTNYRIGDNFYNINDNGVCTLIISALIPGADGNLYYVDETGALVTGRKGIRINDKFYNIGADGACTMIVFSLFTAEDGRLYYVDEQGALVTGKTGYPINNCFYNIDASGVCTLIFSTFFTDSDGRLFYLDENGAKVTNQFMDKDGDTLYFGDDGAQVFNQWIFQDEIWRYVNGQGVVIKNKTRITGGYYGTFDAAGSWTAIENTFFQTTLDNGEAVTLYAGEGGNVSGAADTQAPLGKRFYSFATGSDGSVSVFLLDGENSAATAEQPSGTWLTGTAFYADANGKLLRSTTRKIDGFYYIFDGEGKGILAASSFIVDDETGNRYYVDANGAVAVNQFIEDGANTIYVGEDGLAVSRQWIKDEKGWRYVNDKGYVIKNSTRAAGGSYGKFDADGYWTAIENTFFSVTLDDGTMIWKYSGTEGLIAGNSDKRQYCFVKDNAGKMRCYLGDDNGNPSSQLITNLWLQDYRINADGYLNQSTTDLIDGMYYRFDNAGHGSVVTYSVSYVLNGGTNSSSNPKNYDGTVSSIALTEPTREGYTFKGWFTDSTFSTAVTELKSKASSDTLTLYAKWEAIPAAEEGTGSSGSSGGSSDRDTSDLTTAAPSTTIVSGSSSGSTGSAGQTTSAAAESAERAAAVTGAAEGSSVTIPAGQTAVSAVVSQTSAGSISGNTIVSAAAGSAVVLSESETAQMATIAVGTYGSARALLASAVQGTTVSQITVATAQGTAVQQNVVLCADGTQIAQKSGAAELVGFDATAAAAETAIQNGTLTLAAAYQAKTTLDLSQYVQSGAAVTYEVTAGANGPAAQTLMEQTSFAAGQQLLVLITDAAGNVTVTPVTVGANGIIQYPIPGISCIVRLLQPAG